MYGMLEWNEARAAYHYRLGQIRDIIGSIRVINETTGERQRAFISVTAAPVDGGVQYKSPGEIIDNITLQIATWKRAERELVAFEQRYKQLTELCVGIAFIRERARAFRENLEKEAGHGHVEDGERASA